MEKEKCGAKIKKNFRSLLRLKVAAELGLNIIVFLCRAVPGCFGSKNQFKEEFSNPVELGQRHNATKRELATGRKVMEKLTIKMSSLFLRRTKALISNQLPKKEDRVCIIFLHIQISARNRVNSRKYLWKRMGLGDRV